MEDLLSSYVPSVGLALTLAAFVVGVSRWANSTLDDDILLRASLWILGDSGSNKGESVLAGVFARVAGQRFGWKRLMVIITSNMVIGSAAYLWFQYFYFSGSENGLIWAPTINLYTWKRFYIRLALESIPLQIITFSTTGFLLGRLLHHVSPERLLAFVIAEILILLFVDTLWIQVILLPYALEGRGMLTGEPWIAYSQFLARSFWVVNYDHPIYLTKYIFSFIWISVAVVFVLLQTINRMGARAAGFASRYINKKRIEEEPIALLGEFVAALVFAGVVAYGVGTSLTP